MWDGGLGVKGGVFVWHFHEQLMGDFRGVVDWVVLLKKIYASVIIVTIFKHHFYKPQPSEFTARE